MKSRNIRIIIILGALGLCGVLINQLFWVQKADDIEKNLLKIEKRNFEISQEQFDDKTTIALTNVRDELLSINEASSGLYLEPVQKITPNYFVVSFYDTLNPSILKNLLIEEFRQYQILEVFEYGIYDCFTDSIIFDRYVNLSESEFSPSENRQVMKWDHDGHYFGVYFPDIDRSFDLEENKATSSFFLSTIAVILIILIFSYAIVVILRQKRLSEVKTDFINNMTHELKTPISTISISSDVLLQDSVCDTPERVKQYAGIIKSENSRLENQVERVLQLAKMEKGQIEYKKEPCSIQEILSTCIANFKPSIEQKGGSIQFENRCTHSNVIGDKLHLTNVFFNLLDNANKYSPEEPIIKVVLEEDPNSLAVSISDSGKGMTKDQIKSIFEKFYRAHTGSVHDVKGFGLGLYYVKRIVEHHKGKVEVQSQINTGSTFTISLPKQ